MAAIGCGPQKRTGMGPVHSPAAVTIPLQKHSKQTNHTKSNRTHTNTTKQTKNTHHKSKVESDRRSSSVTIDEGEVILGRDRLWESKFYIPFQPQKWASNKSKQFSDIILRILRFLAESSGVTKLELFQPFPHCK